jgi:hypothetical protein
MRESRTYGSVRGARSNARPYRDCELAAWVHAQGAGGARQPTAKLSAAR